MSSATTAHRTRPVYRRKRFWTVLYLGALILSHLVRIFIVPDPKPLRTGQERVEVARVGSGHDHPATVSISYFDHGPQDAPPERTLLLIHGTPLASASFNRVYPEMARDFRVLIPDLPGFGRSTLGLPDYSLKAHAVYLAGFMDALKLKGAHVVGYSQGGGVGIQLAHQRPALVRSLTLLSSIGVQELELLGDYYLNHGLYTLQYGFVWLLQEGLPHFGLLDGILLSRPYARNFMDSDQRPLRQKLQELQPPALILHGARDRLVPPEAAYEHERLLPQSELLMEPQRGHGMVFSHGPSVAAHLSEFVDRVNQGHAPDRAHALPERIARAQIPFDPDQVPRPHGMMLIMVMVLLALGTLVTEDLTCISAGLMVANGNLTFFHAFFACFCGIYFGDFLLYLAGRVIGRPALRHAPLKWILNESDLNRSARWFQKRGEIAIIISRFIPGTRGPTYFACGVLGLSFARFAFVFALAALLWTPILVWAASAVGVRLLAWLEVYQHLALPTLLTCLALYLFFEHILLPCFTFRGRRLLLSRWRQLTRLEFWSTWIIYLPVLVRLLPTAIRHRSLTLFTVSNPGIPASGFVGESKMQIMDALQEAGDALAAYRRIPGKADAATRWQLARSAIADLQLDFPVVLKPDVGQRGTDVAILRSYVEIETYLEAHPHEELMIQAFAPGPEFGVFYYRMPDEDKGQILAITEKRFVSVIGDGEHNLEYLILADDRTVCTARKYLASLPDRLGEVPALGEEVTLSEIGNHARGTLFLDGTHFKTPELEAEIDRISQTFDGFYLGRYDIRVPTLEAFQAGQDLKIIELNGVTGEATVFYDPDKTKREAYHILTQQWKLAMEIGAQNRRKGHRPTPLRSLVKMALDYKRSKEQ